MKRKSLLIIVLMALFAPWVANAQSVIIGSGTATSAYLPTRSYNKYTITQQIYTAAEINASGTITSVSLYRTDGYTGTNNARKFDIYMAHTTKSAFASSSDWESLTEDNLVYHGTEKIALPQNQWYAFTLDTPFAYNGTDNLIIVIIDRTNGYNTYGEDNTYLVFGTSTNYQAMYATSDNYANLNPNGTNGSSSLSGTRQQVKNQIILGGIQQACARPTNLAATLDATDHTIATLNWTENSESTSWVLQYGTNSEFTAGTYTQETVNTNPTKDLTGLIPETTYYARVRPSCSETAWSDVCEFKPSASVCDQIGTGSSTAYLVYTSYGCTYSQHIYTATELTDLGFTAGDIVSVSFYYSGTSSSYDKTQSIYMGTTTKTSYSGYTASDFESDVTLVYGPTLLSYVAGWREYELTEPFTWDGASNIVVGMLTNANNGTSSGWSTHGTSTSPDYRTIYRYRDSTPIDITDLASVPNGSRSTTRPNISLCILSTPTPKPRNLEISNITSSTATATWDAASTGTPTGYQFQYKYATTPIWPDTWNSLAANVTHKDLTALDAGTTYDFRVRANYAEGDSYPIETQFTTLDECAFPTDLTATITPGLGTIATLSWTKGYDETEWVLQYGTDNTFAAGTYTEKTDGFTVNDNTVTANLTGLTAEATYYARVMANCGSTTSSPSNVASFIPTNFVDYTYNSSATSSANAHPFMGNNTNASTNQSQFIIPYEELDELTGGTIRSITYYTSNTTTTNWGGVIFDVYMAEVANNTFSEIAFVDWATLTNVYTGTVSLSNGMMTVTFDQNYTYNGGNLLIGFKTNTAGTTTQSINWTASYKSNEYNVVYQYGTNDASRSAYHAKITFNYLPSPYRHPIIDEANCTVTTTSAHIAWTVPGATPTGYQYQYKLSSDTEWPTNWTSVTTTYADLNELLCSSSYDFRVKALYDGGHESIFIDYSFITECDVITNFPWSERFDSYNAGDFSHPCWVNEHISGDGTNIFMINASTVGGNTTKQLKLPDQNIGTLTKLRLPEMNLPNNNYQFVIDVYRSNSTYATERNPYEGIRVYASTDGNIDGATELAFIPRQYNETNGAIPAEEAEGWYTYELPIGISGNCFIILRGESQYCWETCMDNFSVEPMPSCTRPSELAYDNVTNHSATIEWTPGDAEQTLWQIAYSKTAFDPNATSFDITLVSTVDATAHPFTLDGILDFASTYYVYVRANCGTATEPDYGPWSRTGIHFTTLEASPAPSNFVADNPASEKVDLVWTAGGGDFESWEIYYVASATAPEAPTAATAATVTDITTLPSTEAPYVLEGLDPLTKYYAWIRAKYDWNSETTYSNWIALTGDFFETLDACPTPYGLVVRNITSVGADISWTGSDDVDSYTVQYRTAGNMATTILSEEFANTSIPTGWARYYGLLDETEGTATLTSDSYGWYFGTDHSVFNSSHAYVNIYGNNIQKWLVTPNITLGEGNILTFDLALTAYSSSATNPQTTGVDDKFIVLVSTDDKETWTALRKWDNAGSPYVYNEIAVAGESIIIDLSGFNGESVYIAFYGESTTSNADNNLHVDNVMVGTPTAAGQWTDATTNETNQSYTLTGLTEGTRYDVHVKSNCTNGEYCEPVTFTTLADGNKVFTNAANDGKWGTAGNWMPTGAPVITDNAILRANATIESGCVAEAKKITFEGTPTPTLTIADGGQLKTDNTVTATVKKNISKYTYDGTDPEHPADGYYLIANPFNITYAPTTFGLITTPSTSYDLYYWNRTASDGLEWRNYKQGTFSLSTSTGYLYANANNVEFSYSGTVRANNLVLSKTVYYTAPSGSNEFSDWNLIGNPYVCDVYLINPDGGAALPYYKMNATGSGFEAATGDAIAPLQGVFYQYQSTVGSSVYFTRTAPSAKSGQLNMNLNRNNEQLDNAILVFGGKQQLGKFSFREGSSKIYMPVEGKDLAITSVEGRMGEQPVSFKAEKNGSYTLNFTNQEVDFSYLHLIDNLTGDDVNLLANPSYTFNAQTTDYESRFRLVFATGSSTSSDTFGFVNANGNFCIFGIEGESTVQVFDVLGHMLSSETFSGSYERKINGAPGVYMVRLINGDDVRTQKVVVR